MGEEHSIEGSVAFPPFSPSAPSKHCLDSRSKYWPGGQQGGCSVPSILVTKTISQIEERNLIFFCRVLLARLGARLLSYLAMGKRHGLPGGLLRAFSLPQGREHCPVARRLLFMYEKDRFSQGYVVFPLLCFI